MHTQRIHPKNVHAMKQRCHVHTQHADALCARNIRNTLMHSGIHIHNTCTQAIEQYDLVLAQDSEDVLVRFLKAQCLYVKGRVNESVEEYDQVLLRHPLHCEARYCRHMPCVYQVLQAYAMLVRTLCMYG